MDDFDSMDRFFKGFMIDQRTRKGAKEVVRNGEKPSKKTRYAGTAAGTNGLRSKTNGDVDIVASDEAVKGTAGM